MTEKQGNFCKRSDFETLQQHVLKLPTAEVTDGLLAKFHDYAPATTLKEIETELKSSLKQLHASTEDSQDELSLKLHRLSGELTKQINLRALEKDRLKAKEAVEARLDESALSEQRHFKQLQQLKSILQTNSTELENCIRKNELETLRDNLEKLPKYDDFQAFKGQLNSEIEKFRLEAWSYKKMFNDCCLMIARYDQILSEKASRQRLAEDLQNHDAKLKNQIRRQTALLDGFQETISDIETKFSDFAQLVQTQVQESVFSSVKKEFLRFKSELPDIDQKFILTQLQTKVNKYDLARLDETKASKKDFEDIMDSVRLVNQQLHQTVIMLTEAIRLNQVSDTKNAFDQRVVHLLRQMQALTSWTQKMDPAGSDQFYHT